MSENYKYEGRDGGRYGTLGEVRSADTRYLQQEKQNQLLAEQNKLLAQQNAETIQLEREKMQIQKQLEEKRIEAERLSHLAQLAQMEHEEEMRILRLCDDVGITKESIDRFEEYLLTPPEELVNIKKEIDDKYGNFEEELTNAKSCLSEDDILIVSNYFRLFPPIYELKKQLSDEREVEIREQFLDWVYNPEEYTKELTKIGAYDVSINLKKAEKNKMVNIIVVIVSVIFLVLICSYNANAKEVSDLVSGLSPILVLVLPLVIIYYFYKMFTDDEIPKLQKKLESISTDMKYVETLKLNKIKPKEVLKNHIEEMEKEINCFSTKEKEFYNDICTKWNNFVEFRKKHYNSKVEKLLIDVGIKETVISFGLEYPKINVNNKEKDGSVEDYVAYFDEL